MKRVSFLSLLTSISLLSSSLAVFAMEEEENNLTYGRYMQKGIPHNIQSIFLSNSEDPEVMTFIFLLSIAQKAGTVNKEGPRFREAIQKSQKDRDQGDKFLQDLKTHFFWIEKVAPSYFQKSYESHKTFLENHGVQFPRALSDIAVYPNFMNVATPLTPVFRSLVVGASETENTRKHNPNTTYMINLTGGHVQDDLTLLSSRNYLDLDGKPYEFDSIYVEVSAPHKLWLFPEVLEFFNRHLIMSGKLTLELDEDPNNPQSINISTISLNTTKWEESFGRNVLEISKDYFGRTLTRKTIEIRNRRSEALMIKYPKEFNEVKKILMDAGFDHIKESDLSAVQFGTKPYEMSKIAKK